ncbi:MAG: DUF4349 domain-containing protein [Gammaproteobacteria bacterium]|uniref:DUF4349 domain-containing protein n=1 Tax=Pseudomonas sp. Hp2 TaxID=701189 RepID=UPI001C4995CD|nr:DUF4349 domain-containing protein [Pseudomonas sp. Hp2]
MTLRMLGLAAAALVAVGCSRQGGEGSAAESFAAIAPAAPAASAKMLQAPEGTFLAYETDVQVRVPAAEIPKRIDAVQQACQQARFGDCAVLSVSQQGGPYASGDIELRIAPAGVEPILKLAGEGGELASRSTRAEDLAQQVADNRMTQERLQKEHARLLEFQQRGDLKVADLLAISQRLAEIEASAEAAQREAAQQRRRIDTQKVTIAYRATGGEQGRSEIGEAFAESGRIFAGSVAFLVRAVAGLAPVAIVVVVLLAVLRGWWRRRRKRGA